MPSKRCVFAYLLEKYWDDTKRVKESTLDISVLKVAMLLGLLHCGCRVTAAKGVMGKDAFVGEVSAVLKTTGEAPSQGASVNGEEEPPSFAGHDNVPPALACSQGDAGICHPSPVRAEARLYDQRSPNFRCAAAHYTVSSSTFTLQGTGHVSFVRLEDASSLRVFFFFFFFYPLSAQEPSSARTHYKTFNTSNTLELDLVYLAGCCLYARASD